MCADVKTDGAQPNPLAKVGQYGRVVHFREQHPPPRIDSKSLLPIECLSHSPAEARPDQPLLVCGSQRGHDVALAACSRRDRTSGTPDQPHVLTSPTDPGIAVRVSFRRLRTSDNVDRSGKSRQSGRIDTMHTVIATRPRRARNTYSDVVQSLDVPATPITISSAAKRHAHGPQRSFMSQRSDNIDRRRSSSAPAGSVVMAPLKIGAIATPANPNALPSTTANVTVRIPYT